MMTHRSDDRPLEVDMRQMMGLLPLGLLLAGCKKDDSLNVLTDPPSVTITNPTEGAHVDQGVEMLILGLVDDAKFDEDQLAPVWSVGGAAVCSGSVVDAGGNAQCAYAFADVGDASITLTVTNPDGQSGTASVAIVVDANGPPQAEILAPSPEGVYYSDQPILFEGLATDGEDPGDALSVAWTSSLDGDLGFDGTPTSAGETSGFTTLSEGEHLVSLDVADSTGRTGEDVTTIVVGPPNSPPDCLIASPLTGDVFGSNDTILFEAVATDVDVPSSMLTVEWSSDKDGPLGSSTPSSSGDVFFATSDLTVATHTITFTVTDEVGASCVDVALITIGDGPEIALVTPVDGDVFNEGAAIPFEATVYDGQDLPTQIDLAWESSIDGVFSTSRANSSGVAKFTDGTLTRGDHTLTLTGTDTDDFTGVDVRTFRVNGLPGAPDIEITPDPPSSDDDLRADLRADAVDPESDALTYAYVWYRNSSVTTHTSDTVPASETSRGDTWRVVVTASDPYGAGGSDSDTVTIGNAAPTLATAALTPDPATEASTFTCTPGAATDSDGDSVSYGYAWRVNGASVAVTSNKLTNGCFGRGDDVECVVTPTDGTTAGAAVTSNLVTVDNSAPTVASASLTPTSAYESSTLTCAPGATADLDGDSVSLAYTWTVSSATIAATSSTLDGTWFSRGDTVTCTVEPSDGTDTGAAVTSNTVTIANSLPTVASVTLTPTSATESSTLACGYSAGSDGDGDAITYSISWKVNGGAISPTTSSLAGTYFSRGDDVTCAVTPNDGTASGTAVTSNTVTIGNTKPSATSVAISPTTAYTSTDLSAAVSGWADADGDAEGYTWQWYKGSAAITGATTNALSSAEFVRGDKISVVATPWDGTDSGTAVTSAVLTISNAAPSGAAASLTPTTAYEGTTLTCTPSGATDADGDSVTYTLAWTVNGATVAATSTTLTGTYFSKGDTVTCTATPSDGTTTGTAATSNTVTILNTAPTLDTVSLTPTTAYESSTLSCAKGAGTDADSDSVSYAYAWEVNGATISPTTTTLSGTYFKRGDSVTCLVTPTDGTTAGSPVESSAVTISNSAPSGTGVTISPSAVTTDADVLAIPAGAADDDGDAVSWVYQWYKNSVALSGATSAGLDDTQYVKNDVLYVTATPYDGTSYGAVLISATLTVSNSAPTAPVVLVTPADADPDDILYCTMPTASTDADGDTITYTYAWTKNGSPTTITTTTVAASFTSDGDTWACTATPSDGTVTGPAGTDAQTVVDATAPDRPIIGAIDRYRNDSAVTLTGTAEGGSELTIYAVCTSGTTSFVTTVPSSGSWSYTATVTAGDDCDFYAYAEDAGGNVSPKSNTVETEVCDPADDYEDSTSYGDACTDSVDEWITLTDAGTTTISVTGNILDSADADWIVVRTSQSVLTSGTNRYHFEVNLVTGASDYAFAVYDGSCASGALECTTAGYTEYEEYANDSGDHIHGIPTDKRDCANSSTRNQCQDLSGTYYIQVFRTGASYNCNEYVLDITNGVW